MEKVVRSKRYIVVVTILIIMVNLSVLENQNVVQNVFFKGDSEKNNDDILGNPITAKPDIVFTNSTELNVTGTYFGSNSLVDYYVPNSNGINYSLPVIDNGGVTGVNLSINTPEVIKSATLIVNDTLGLQPNYTIQWNNQEFINENATFIIDANSSSVYPLGNITIFINGSESMNFTGDGHYSFNISRSSIQDVNVTTKFYYKNNTFYSEEEMIVAFYDIFNISLNSIVYEINYTHEVYKNQNGSIEIDLTDGSNSTVGFVNVTIDSIQKSSFYGEGIHNLNFNEGTLGVHEISVLVYTDDDNLYANETFEVNIIEPINETIIVSGWGSTVIKVTYNKFAKIGENATVWIQTSNVATKYEHGNISVFLDTFFEQNYTLVGDNFFNVTKSILGNVNVSMDFYNSTNEYNQTVQFNITFFNDFNYTAIQSINYTLLYPFYYYPNHNATINFYLNDGTNLTLGTMGLYYNDILNTSFIGSGTYSNNITSFETGLQDITLELNYSGSKWFFNESIRINFLTKPELYGISRIKTDIAPDNGYNTSTKEYSSPSAYAMEFKFDQLSNITGFSLHCDYFVSLPRYLKLELRNNSIDGDLIAYEIYSPLILTGAKDWKEFDFHIDNLNAGIYYLVVDGSNFGGIVLHDAFSWSYAHGDINIHNASYYDTAWRNCNTDFLLKVNYNSWEMTTFDEIDVNATMLNTHVEMDKKTSVLAHLNFTESNGPWYPNSGVDSIPVNFTVNQECRFNITFDVSYNVSQITNYTFYLIQDTSNVDNILWNVTFPGVNYNYNNFSDVDIIQYNATIHIPQSWFAVNGTSESYQEEFNMLNSITLNNSASIENWNISAFSLPSNSLIEVYEMKNAINPQRTPGDNITGQCTVFGNSADFNANLSIWKDNDLKYNTTQISNTEIFNFTTWEIPLGFASGEYEIFFYWSNGTDVAYNETTFVIKEKANFTSNADYLDIDHMQNATFKLSYQDFYNGNNISNGQIETNWTNDWSFNYTDGIYFVSFNSTGMEKGTKLDVNISISSVMYKNESLILSVFIQVPTLLIITPDASELITIVNSSFIITAIYYSEFDIGGVDNSSNSLYFDASIDEIDVPIEIIPDFGDPNPKRFKILVNLSYFKEFPQAGDRSLKLEFFFKNSTTHYTLQEKSYLLQIRPQESFFEPISSNAHDSTDLLNLFEYVDQNSRLELVLKLQKSSPVNYTDFINETISDITIYAKIGINSYLLENLGDGLYIFNESVDLFDVNIMYKIIFIHECPDLTQSILEINYQIIQRLNISINIDHFPQTVKQFSTMSISGYVFIENGTDMIPFANVPVTIRVEFFGALETNTVEFIVYTSDTGRFILLNITIPYADEYIGVVIRIHVDETRYTDTFEESKHANIIKLSVFAIVTLIVGVFIAFGLITMLLYLKIIIPITKNKTQREIEGDIFMLKSRETRRKELKTRLANSIKVPAFVDSSEVSATSMPNIGKEVNVIVLPPEVNDKKHHHMLKQSKEDINEFLNRDILLYKKEKYLFNALKSEQMGYLDDASDYFEKAALYSEKLGQGGESLIYLKKVESINEVIKSNNKKGKNDNKFFLFVKSRFKPRDSDLVEDMKAQSKNLNVKLFKDVFSKENVSLPFANKRDHDDYLEYKKLMEDFD